MKKTKKKKIGIVGSGYVGTILGVCFSEKGHQVTLIDLDKSKVDCINRKIPHIHEAGLEELLKKVKLRASTDIREARDSDLFFICVGTPSESDGGVNLGAIFGAAKDIGVAIEGISKYQVVTVKSTVTPGTTKRVGEIVREHSKKGVGLCMNPEFLKEGKAISDFKFPDRIVIGSDTKEAGDLVESLYAGFPTKNFVRTNIETAEMIKYTANSFLATKISFANEIANICQKIGVDVYDVMDAVALDSRIERKFLDAGAGFGGSCFPKDVKALEQKAIDVGVEPTLLSAVLNVNKNQPYRVVEMLKEDIDLREKEVCVLGLAFKPGTDDIREAPSLSVISELLRLGAKPVVYDPKAMDNVRKVFGDRITYASDAKQALRSKDACIIMTEWEEFKKLGQEDFLQMRNPFVIDGRKTLDVKEGWKIKYRRIGK